MVDCGLDGPRLPSAIRPFYHASRKRVLETKKKTSLVLGERGKNITSQIKDIDESSREVIYPLAVASN